MLAGGVVSFPGYALPPIKECGNFIPTGMAGETWTGYWTYRHIPGFTPVTNLTTRVVGCSAARPFSLHVSRKGSRRYQGFTCRWIHHYESYDVRCTNGGRVIHWQGGV